MEWKNVLNACGLKGNAYFCIPITTTNTTMQMNNIRILRNLTIVITLHFVVVIMNAQPHYKIINYEELNNQVTTVNRIVRDTHGMMWFSSDNGLYRYDGYSFVNFKSYNGDGVDIPSNRIRKMFASSDGGIWCLLSERPFLFDTRTCQYIDVLKDYEQRQGKKFRISKLRTLACGITWLFAKDGTLLTLEDARPIQSIKLISTDKGAGLVSVVCDQKGRSWVLTTHSTYIYNRGKTKRYNQAFQRIIVSGQHVWLLNKQGRLAKYDERSFQLKFWHHKELTDVVSDISKLDDGRIVIIANSKLLLVSPDGRQVTCLKVKTPVQKVMEDHQGRFWLLGVDGVLSVIDKEYRMLTRLEKIKTNRKCDIINDKHGTVWIFTGNGDTFYVLPNKQVHPVKYKNGGMHVNITNMINDGQGGFWFINYNHAYRLTFGSPNYHHLPLHGQSQVRCVVGDTQKRLLVCSCYDETVVVLSAKGERLGWLGRDGRIHHKWTSFGAAVYSGYLASDGTLWLGTKMNGLFRLRLQLSGNYEVNQYQKEEKNSITDNTIYAIKEDVYHRLWIGTHKGGLCCILDCRMEHPRFLTYKNGQFETNIDPSSSIRALLVTPEQHLIIGTFNGLFVADIKGKKIRKLNCIQHLRETNRKESLSSSDITDVLQTKDGRLFLATSDGGINELLTNNIMAEQLNFRHYNHQTGFPADIIHAIKEFNGALWCIAPSKLIEMQLGQSPKPSVSSFLLREKPQFTSCKPMEMENEKWVMGTENGAVLVNLNELKDNSFVPSLVVTGVSKENAAINHAVVWNDTIVLNSRERSLTIWFSALDYENTELVAYAYRIGNSKDWNYIGQNHSITFAEMQPGTHCLTIRSTNSNGMWCNNERQLTIIVTPTFLEEPLGKIFVVFVVMILISIVGYTILYIYRIKRKQRETMEKYLSLLEEKENNDCSVSLVKEEFVVDSEDDKLMKRIVAYMDENLGNSDITIDDIAQTVGISRASLHRKMKRQMGTSPMEFLREARIRKAVKMLSMSTNSVSSIAYLCGFSDPKYFSKCFRQTMGISPTEYRINNSESSQLN